ncbi:hypothetical protein ACP272_13110 (plasmid) [Staphylococcus xylosus]|uniref:hypothetical protein n=1 Tax=Staphylococcus xylosus TaxID=1288 RepID=UPI003CEED833
MSKQSRETDIAVLNKIYEEVDKYKWRISDSDDEFAQAISFPEVAEKFLNSFSAKINDEMAVVVGAYKVAFYHDEERFTWEKREYAAIISLKFSDKYSEVFFIDNEDYKELKRPLINIKSPIFNSKFFNLITSLYEKVNRNVNDVESIYNNFLNK